MDKITLCDIPPWLRKKKLRTKNWRTTLHISKKFSRIVCTSWMSPVFEWNFIEESYKKLNWHHCVSSVCNLVKNIYLPLTVLFNILRHILINMKTSLQMGQLRRFFSPDVCELLSRHIGKFVQASERQIIFWPSGSKFAVECDWKRRFPKAFKIWVFFEKNRLIFRKKKLNFFKISKGWNLL